MNDTRLIASSKTAPTSSPTAMLKVLLWNFCGGIGGHVQQAASGAMSLPDVQQQMVAMLTIVNAS